MVPVINVKRHWNGFLPKIWIRFERAQPFFGRRTTATTFGGEEFDERRLRLTAFKRRFRGENATNCGQPHRHDREREDSSFCLAHTIKRSPSSFSRRTAARPFVRANDRPRATRWL